MRHTGDNRMACFARIMVVDIGAIPLDIGVGYHGVMDTLVKPGGQPHDFEIQPRQSLRM